MSLDFAADHLLAAVRSVAHSDGPLQARLQTAWNDSVQMVWEKPCLTRELLAEFKAVWERYTARSNDPRTTQLRDMTMSELKTAVDELVDLAVQTSLAARCAPLDVKLATVADQAN